MQEGEVACNSNEISHFPESGTFAELMASMKDRIAAAHCTKCREFWSNKDGLCSSCYYEEHGVGITTVQTGCVKLSQLDVLYQEFCQQYNVKRKVLTAEAEFRILKASCYGKPSGHIFAILNGNDELPAYMLPAKFAAELLKQCEEYSGKMFWTHCHAVGPFVYDVWNIKNYYGGVLECYYGTDVFPSIKKDLFMIWFKSINPPLSQVSSHKLDTCAICLDDILTQHARAVCKQCHKYLHGTCCREYCLKTTAPKCLYCQTSWSIQMIESTDYGSIWYFGRVL